MSHEYRSLRDKVDDFCAAAEAKASDALACKRGCDGCCHVWLTVSEVEADAIRKHVAALPAEQRAELSARGSAQAQREAAAESPSRCAMLDGSGACGIYAARPMICRTQGLALRYPAGTVPEQSVRWRAGEGDEASEMVACPLNYQERTPQGPEMLDADMLNTLLGVVNMRHTEHTRGDPDARTALTTLAIEASVLA